jgi:hypothetical protein
MQACSFKIVKALGYLPQLVEPQEPLVVSHSWNEFYELVFMNESGAGAHALRDHATSMCTPMSESLIP